MTDRLSSTPLRLLGTREGVSELSAINTTILKNGSCVYITELRAVFALLRESTDVADGVNIVAPLEGPGRWFRWDVGSNAWVAQADWYVDEQNVTGNASDGNIGNTADAPLATMTEWSRRVGGSEVVLEQTTQVHLLSDVEPDRSWWFFGQTTLPQFLRITGEAPVELLSPTAITNRTNWSAGATRPSITVAGIDWNTAGPGGTSLLNKRCRVVQSVGSQLDALFWIEEIDSGDPQIAYINRPYESTNPPAFGVNRTLAIGDVIVVEELTGVGQPNIRQSTNGISFAVGAVNVLLEHVRGPGATSVAVLGDLDQTAGVALYGCDMAWSRIICAFGSVMASEWGTCPNTNYFTPNGGNCFFSGCSLVIGDGAPRIMYSGTVSFFNSSSFTCNLDTGTERGYTNIQFYEACAFWNWTAIGLLVNEGSTVRFRALVWGSSTAAAPFLVVRTGGFADWNVQPTASNAGATDFSIGGVADVYASLPAAGQNPGNNNAWFVARA